MVFSQENIHSTNNIAENSWDILHEDIAKLLLFWEIQIDDSYCITRFDRRVFAKVRNGINLIPDTQDLTDFIDINGIRIDTLESIDSIIWQRLNGHVVLPSKIKHKQIGTSVWKWHTYPNIVAYIEHHEPQSDVHEKVHQIFPGHPHVYFPARIVNEKYEEISEEIRVKNKLLIEKLIASS